MSDHDRCIHDDKGKIVNRFDANEEVKVEESFNTEYESDLMAKPDVDNDEEKCSDMIEAGANPAEAEEIFYDKFDLHIPLFPWDPGGHFPLSKLQPLFIFNSVTLLWVPVLPPQQMHKASYGETAHYFDHPIKDNIVIIYFHIRILTL